MNDCPRCGGQILMNDACLQCGYRAYMSLDYSYTIEQRNRRSHLNKTKRTGRKGKENLNYGARLPGIGRAELAARGIA